MYFRALAPGQYWVVAPAFVTADDPAARIVALEPGFRCRTCSRAVWCRRSDLRAYATREARYRLHQQRFKLDVMRAYRHRCAICTLRERELVQAAHIVPDSEHEGVAAVVNGIALCAIHHLAFDRNLLGIDPQGVVHIAGRLLREIDGPMLRTGLQGFHGGRIALPRRPRRPAGPAPAGAALRAIREGFRLSIRQRTLSIEESNPRTGVGCAAHPRVALDSAAGCPCRSIRR